METLATFQKTFPQTIKDYRVGLFNDLTLYPDNPLFITGKYLTFGSYNRVSIPAGVMINQNVRICQRKWDSSHVPRTSLRFT